MQWIDFDAKKTINQALPPVERYVLLLIAEKPEDEFRSRLVPAVAVGYLANLDTLQFIIPGVGGEVLAWSDTLGDDFTMPMWKRTDQPGVDRSHAIESDTSGVPSIEAAYQMGAKGGPVIEEERLSFEAWMRGHCWDLSAQWRDGTYYGKNETVRNVCPHAMHIRQLWAVWRDRAALAKLNTKSVSGPRLMEGDSKSNLYIDPLTAVVEVLMRTGSKPIFVGNVGDLMKTKTDA